MSQRAGNIFNLFCEKRHIESYRLINQIYRYNEQ